ncbi:MAG: ABC transporter permease [Promethearchaeota archaeon]|jgi:peptide/nickel transport system permease protein
MIEVEKQVERTMKKDNKPRILLLILFYLFPGWRIPEFSKQEFEIEKIRSKRRFFRHLLTTLTIVGTLIILTFIFMGIFTPWLTKYPLQDLVPPSIPGVPFALPSPEHPLGTTNNGYDVLARMLWGARTSLYMALIPTGIAVGGGLILGTISAYFGGTVDYIFMRAVDLLYSIPTFIIVLILTQIFGLNMLEILMIYGGFAITGNLRFMRSLVLQIREMVYIKAAKTGGALKFKVMFSHVLPNALAPMILQFFGQMAITMLGMAAIAFLGLTNLQIPNWGQDIARANIFEDNVLAFLIPGLATGLFAIAAMLIGDGLRDAIDPRLKL